MIAYYKVVWTMPVDGAGKSVPESLRYETVTHSARAAELIAQLLSAFRFCGHVSIQGVEDTDWPF